LEGERRIVDSEVTAVSGLYLEPVYIHNILPEFKLLCRTRISRNPSNNNAVKMKEI
jgi:hypothetical protein